MAMLECSTGYYLGVGHRTFRCLSNGTWEGSDDPATCKSKYWGKHEHHHDFYCWIYLAQNNLTSSPLNKLIKLSFIMFGALVLLPQLSGWHITLFMSLQRQRTMPWILLRDIFFSTGFINTCPHNTYAAPHRSFLAPFILLDRKKFKNFYGWVGLTTETIISLCFFLPLSHSLTNTH